MRVEVLARRLGVTKGGFYGYFADRSALLAEVLDTWERRWARRDADVAERLRRVDNHRLGYLREQFAPSFPDPEELEARCFLAFCWAIAGDAIAADHPGGSRADVTRRVAALVFGEGGDA